MLRTVLVSQRGDTWEVRVGMDGLVQTFRSETAALKFATNAARLLRTDDGEPTQVRMLLPHGDWETRSTFEARTS